MSSGATAAVATADSRSVGIAVCPKDIVRPVASPSVGSGVLEKNVTVAAVDFSSSAREEDTGR